MIQISKMNHYWIMPVFVLFLLRPLLSFAEEKDPFNNSIENFDENIFHMNCSQATFLTTKSVCGGV